MLAEVRWKPVADSQYRALTHQYRRAASAVDGALRTIGFAGHRLPFAPNAGGFRTVETRPEPGVPAFVLVFSEDADGVFWVEEIRAT